MKRLLFYSDTNIYGGHEKMLLLMLMALLEANVYDITIILFCRNDKFKTELENLQKIFIFKVVLTPIRSKSIQSLRSCFQWADLFTLTKLINRKYDLICVGQGSIEIGSKMLIAARICKITLISYIPNTTNYARINARFALVRQLVGRIFYKLPNYFITISEFVKDYINQYSDAKVFILPNAIDFSKLHVKNSLSVMEDDVSISLIGAISKTKNQAFIINWLNKLIADKDELVKVVKILFIGIGNDFEAEKIKAQIKKHNLSYCISLFAWTDDVSNLLNKTDVLLIPSLVEGVPLVMLEAAATKTIILANDIDGMHDFLPEDMKFSLNDYSEFTYKLKSLVSNSNRCHVMELLERNYNKVINENTINHFKLKTKFIFNSILHNN